MLSYKSRTLDQWMRVPRESLSLICNAERINTRGTASVLARRLFDHFRNVQLTNSSAVLQPLTSSSSIVSSVISNSSCSTTANFSSDVPLQTTSEATTVPNINIDHAILSTSIRELIRQAVQEALVINNLVPPSVTNQVHPNVNFAPSVPPFTVPLVQTIPNHHGGLELPSAVPIQPNLFSNLAQNLTNETANPHQYTTANNFNSTNTLRGLNFAWIKSTRKTLKWGQPRNLIHAKFNF